MTSRTASIKQKHNNTMRVDSTCRRIWTVLVTAAVLQHSLTVPLGCRGLSLSSFSRFHGTPLVQHLQETTTTTTSVSWPSSYAAAATTTRGGGVSSLTMRKQKASDRRTRRMQRGADTAEEAQALIRDSLATAVVSLTQSPMDAAGGWKQKQKQTTTTPTKMKSKTIIGRASASKNPTTTTVTGGRGRSRKRSMLYNSLSSYHNKFLQLLTTEYRAEVSAT